MDWVTRKQEFRNREPNFADAGEMVYRKIIQATDASLAFAERNEF